MGAAYGVSKSLGFSTTLAVLCHEVPHELGLVHCGIQVSPTRVGDFVVLLESGWSVKNALLANFASSLTAFLGLIIGLEASNTLDAQQWILALAAGMFLYIGLTDIVSVEPKSQDVLMRVASTGDRSGCS